MDPPQCSWKVRRINYRHNEDEIDQINYRPLLMVDFEVSQFTRYYVRLPDDPYDGAVLCDPERVGSSTMKRVTMGLDDDKYSMERILRQLLAATSVPESSHQSILDEIGLYYDFFTTRKTTTVLSATLDVTSFEELVTEDVMNVMFARSNVTEDGVRPRPASKASIDGLERVVLRRDATKPDVACVICIEEIVSEVEAIRMPCGHVYHRNCIVKWLETSHYCPLCKYEMPCDELAI